MTITIVRVDGREEQHDTTEATVWKLIQQLIGASSLDSVNLRDGRMMFVDDSGYDVELVEHEPRDGYAFVVERKATRARKPVNQKATALYHAVCVPGTTHQIVGDVAIVVEADFREDA